MGETGVSGDCFLVSTLPLPPRSSGIMDLAGFFRLVFESKGLKSKVFWNKELWDFLPPLRAGWAFEVGGSVSSPIFGVEFRFFN